MNGLETDLCGIRLKNPLIAASGTFGYGDEVSDLLAPDALGGVALKGLTLKPREGNPCPRIAETPSGVLNAVGLQNIGVERFLKEKAPVLRNRDSVFLANVAGASVEENCAIVEALDPEACIRMFELNVSCPNVAHGGMAFGTDAGCLAELVAAVRKRTRKPLIVKLSPNVTDIAVMAKVCEDGGADAVSAINTIHAMVIDTKKRKPLLGNKTGGLSGPAVRPVGVRAVWQIFRAVKIPVVGLGGVMTANDALEYILAGATAFQVGTALFSGLDAVSRILSGLKEYMEENSVKSLAELVGAAHRD
jgi:dihydroorotate dehydrogenase (NAD+) catalytic subunit